MTNPEDLLYHFAMEFDRTTWAPLPEWVQRFPKRADELIDFAIVLMDEDEDDDLG